MREEHHPSKPLRLMRPGGIPYVVPPKRPLSAPAPPAPRLIQDVRTRRRRRPRVSLGTVVQLTPVVARPIAPRAVAPALPHRLPARSKPKTHLKKSAKSSLKVLPIIGLILLGPLIAQSVQLGELLIGVVGVVAVVRRVESRLLFSLALMGLVATILLLLVSGSNLTAATNFATYAFLFMVIGIILQTMELWRDKKGRVERQIDAGKQPTLS